MAKKYGETNEVIAAVECHHEEQEPKSILGVMAIAADAISAARPRGKKGKFRKLCPEIG